MSKGRYKKVRVSKSEEAYLWKLNNDRQRILAKEQMNGWWSAIWPTFKWLLKAAILKDRENVLKGIAHPLNSYAKK